MEEKTNYLVHHGIKGQRWGVRRYQNSDGSLTDIGKRRLGIKSARKYYKIDRLKRRQEKTNSFKKYRHLDKKIRKVSTRLDRKGNKISKKEIEAGRKIVAKRRLIARTTLAAAAPAISIGATIVGGPIGLATIPASAIVTGKSISKIPYYHMDNRRYGKKENWL